MSVSDLKDCAHANEELAGVCQWRGCGKQLCTKSGCLKDCSQCGISLCKEHQNWLDGGQQVFCQACGKSHVKQKAGFVLIDRLIGGRGGGA